MNNPDVKVGDIFILGNLIHLKVYFVRIDRIKRSKVKVSYFNSKKYSIVTGKKAWSKTDFTHDPSWTPMPKWEKLSELDLIPLSIEQLLKV